MESRVQFTDRCATWKFTSGAENLVLQALKFQKFGIFRKFTGRARMSLVT
jgi:hypothetical protein